MSENLTNFFISTAIFKVKYVQVRSRIIPHSALLSLYSCVNRIFLMLSKRNTTSPTSGCTSYVYMYMYIRTTTTSKCIISNHGEQEKGKNP